MNSASHLATPAVPAPPRRTRRGSVGRWIVGLLGAGAVLTAIVVANALTQNREARTLHRAILAGLDARSSTRVQFSIGPLLLGTGRVALSFIDGLPNEARLALQSVKAVGVGIYSLNHDPIDSPKSNMLGAADAAMLRAGWSRVVAVVQRQKCVLIYTPNEIPGDGPVRLCLAVMEGRKLVVVSATVLPTALVELAAKHRGLARR